MPNCRLSSLVDDVWVEAKRTMNDDARFSDMMVSPQNASPLKSKLDDLGFEYLTVIDDVQVLIKSHKNELNGTVVNDKSKS